MPDTAPRVFISYAHEQNPLGSAYCFAELIRCAKRAPNWAGETLEELLAQGIFFAHTCGIKDVHLYVIRAAREYLDGDEQELKLLLERIGSSCEAS